MASNGQVLEILPNDQGHLRFAVHFTHSRMREFKELLGSKSEPRTSFSSVEGWTVPVNRPEKSRRILCFSAQTTRTQRAPIGKASIHTRRGHASDADGGVDLSHGNVR